MIRSGAQLLKEPAIAARDSQWEKGTAIVANWRFQNSTRIYALKRSSDSVLLEVQRSEGAYSWVEARAAELRAAIFRAWYDITFVSLRRDYSIKSRKFIRAFAVQSENLGNRIPLWPSTVSNVHFPSTGKAFVAVRWKSETETERERSVGAEGGRRQFIKTAEGGERLLIACT
ncbi:PREDICTED: uncharacterized protein LOC106745015 isoform X2 [Dinoponera quadriceps]|uniref:Uncharacterized protein LOC106745015 isoform X2 n=1 Tax=Dinoponera quadriceps TaxID=609295 RepID=A0A6P3XCW2_DINQU|nr:PREDICTED: uncharacterized protein LOC106745015 isoform X2 [Dinoponera quadriceps]